MVPRMEISDQLRIDVRNAMKASGFESQLDLALSLEISPQYLSDVLTKRRRFSATLLQKVATALALEPKRARRWHRWGAIEAGWQI